MNHASLFSGIGGFDLAAETVGFKNIFHCEIDPDNREHLELRFPNSDQYGDIRELDGTKYHGSIDIISGGFPCQDISIAKTHVGGGLLRGSKVKNRDFGKSTRVLFGRLDLESSSLKTAQCSLEEDLKTSFAIFPSSGMMLNGDCFMLPSSDMITSGQGFTVWPTPAASDGTRLLRKVESYKKYLRNNHQDKLVYQCHLNGMTANQTLAVYCWMMGFTPNWIKRRSSDTEMP